MPSSVLDLQVRGRPSLDPSGKPLWGEERECVAAVPKGGWTRQGLPTRLGRWHLLPAAQVG